MARFRYRMQSILDIKEKMETQAKQEFADAKNALDREIEKLEELKKRKTGYELEAKKLLQDELNIREIIENKSAIIKMEELITGQQMRVKRAEGLLEKARLKLQEVMTERKTHETLKEKAFEEFMLEENRAESKSIDELTSYTYSNKRRIRR